MKLVYLKFTKGSPRIKILPPPPKKEACIGQKTNKKFTQKIDFESLESKFSECMLISKKDLMN